MSHYGYDEVLSLPSCFGVLSGEKEEDVDLHYPEMKGGKGVSVSRPFRCSICGKNSRWKWDVAKHIKMVHRGQLAEMFCSIVSLFYFNLLLCW